jgi:hypothetical protein
VREEFYQDHNIQEKRNFKGYNDYLRKLFYPFYCQFIVQSLIIEISPTQEHIYQRSPRLSLNQEQDRHHSLSPHCQVMSIIFTIPRFRSFQFNQASFGGSSFGHMMSHTEEIGLFLNVASTVRGSVNIIEICETEADTINTPCFRTACIQTGARQLLNRS